jgi:hypothetical protein
MNGDPAEADAGKTTGRIMVNHSGNIAQVKHDLPRQQWKPPGRRGILYTVMTLWSKHIGEE